MTYLGIVQEIVQVKYDLLNNYNNESNNMTYLDIFPEMVTVKKKLYILEFKKNYFCSIENLYQFRWLEKGESIVCWICTKMPLTG